MAPSRRLKPTMLNEFYGMAATGVGIAPTDIPHLFDEFYQASDNLPSALSNLSNHHGGTGLGLTITKHLGLSIN